MKAALAGTAGLVAAELVTAELVTAELSTTAPTADNAIKPFRVNLIGFLPGAGRERVDYSNMSDSSSSKHRGSIPGTTCLLPPSAVVT
jgi:hypothetical protein